MKTTSLKVKSFKYENHTSLDDFNIDTKTKAISQKLLEEFCDLISLINLIKSETCHTKTLKSAIDLILPNKTSSFPTSCVTKASLSNYRRLLATFLNLTLLL